MSWRSIGAAVVLVCVAAPAARADERPPGGPKPCTDWCGTPHAWMTPTSGSGPETSAATLVWLGAAGETLRSAAGARSETAAVLGFEFRFPLALRDSAPGADSRVMRLRVVGQRLGWRVDDDGPGAGLAGGGRAGEAASLGDTADTGGSVGLGYTATLAWFSHRSKLAATVDAEGAAGLGVRGGLGLRTRDVSARAVGAAGLALGLDGRAGGLRAHARVLRALAGEQGWSTAAEAGVGVATRFDWPGFRRPWPIELAIDLRARRGLGADGDARERELTTALALVPARGFSRISLVGTATDERLVDGSHGRGRALMVRFDRPIGGL